MRVTDRPSRRAALGLLLVSTLTLAGFAPPALAAPGGKDKGDGPGGGGPGGPGSGSSNAAGKSKGTQAPGNKQGGAAVQVKHRNGMLERILRGRYEMKDNRGRTIVNRPATAADRRRLIDLASHQR
jgi:hypothetical protein